MYFHLVGIKETDGKQYKLDFIISGGDITFIRGFLSTWGVVIIYLDEFNDSVESFGNVRAIISYKQQEIQLIMKGDNLEERTYFIAFLGLAPQIINFIDNPIPELQMQELIKKVFINIKEQHKHAELQKMQDAEDDAKKYEEKAVSDGLAIINSTIDRIGKIRETGVGILSGNEMKTLEDYSNDMKKIRLGTNFNKMAAIVLEANALISKAEGEIFSALGDKSFIIQKDSYITNIDVISECHTLDRAKNKFVFNPKGLTFTENAYNLLGSGMILGKFAIKDIMYTIKNEKATNLFKIVMDLSEFFVLTTIITLSILWLLAPLLGADNFSLYFLPAFGWLGLLLYLFNNINFKRTITKIVTLCVLIIVYKVGLTLLLNTFILN